MATTDYTLESTLPASVDAERSILGAILLDNFAYNQAAEHLRADDFALDSHRRIYSRMVDLAETSRPIDTVTLTEELARRREVEAVGGVAYLTSLTDGLPRRPNIEHYVKIVRDKALLRADSCRQHRHRARRRAVRSGGRDPRRRRGRHLPAIREPHRTRLPRHPRNRQGILRLPRRSLRARAAHHRPGNPLRGFRQHDQRAAALRPDHRRRPPFHGQDRLRHEHRRECGGARQEGGGHVLAGNVARILAPAPAVLPRPGGFPQDAHRLSGPGGLCQAGDRVG